MISILEKISRSMLASGVNTLTIIVDGKYFMHEGKRVFVENKTTGNHDDTFVSFFTRAKVGSVNQNTVLPYGIVASSLRRILFSNNLYGIKSDLFPNEKDCSIQIDADMGLLLLESGLYAAAKLLAYSGQQDAQVYVGEELASTALSRSLRSVFEGEAFNVYRDLVYATGANRFLRKLLNAKKFYNIQRVYVPVFVKYSGVFDPFEGKESLLESTVMWKTAVESGREIRFGESLSGYLLTHEEICRAFGMKHFVRFTSNLWYSLFVGLLYPDKSDFPNVLTDCFVQPKGMNDIPKFKKSYTLKEFEQLLQNYQTRLANAGPEFRTELENEVSVLQQYFKADTLYAATLVAHPTLVSLGSVALDERENTTVDKIYEYLKEAQLLLVE